MKIDVLDHGYVEFIEPWGHGKGGVGIGMDVEQDDFEVGIIEAARQSTQGMFRGWDAKGCDCGVATTHGYGIKPCLETCATNTSPGDKRLLSYLYDNNHATPFEFAGMVVEVQAPLMVFREWHRHRTQSYNEMSGRYTKLPDLYYHMDPEKVWERAQLALSPTTKQMAALNGVGPLTHEAMTKWLAEDEELSWVLEQHYQKGLRIGLPKEIARKKTPIDHYSRMRASANLRNWLAFMTLRCDPHAQWEIRQFALAVGDLIARTFPRTFDLWQAKRST